MSTLTDLLEQEARTRMAQDGAPGAIVVLLRAGVPVWTGAFVLADPTAGQPMTEENPMRVDSLAKPTAAWAAMQLPERGRLDLDVPVNNCLQHQPPPESSPSFNARQLLSHSPGSGSGDRADRYGPDEARPALPNHLDRDFETVAVPGTRFACHDTGYNILELA